MNKLPNDTLAIIADVFSLYNVTDESFRYKLNDKNPNRFSLNDWNYLTDILLSKLSTNYPEENPAYIESISKTIIIPVGNLSVKEARKKINEARKKINEEHLERQHTGFFVDINPDYTNTWFDNIIKIELNQVIQTILIDYIDRNTIYFNHIDYGVIFKTIVENRSILSQMRPEIAITIKAYINFLYGALSNRESIIRCDVYTGDIIAKFNKFTQTIFDDFRHYVIYIDIDTIYMRNYHNVVNDIIRVLTSKYDFTYNVEDGYSGMFLAKKKFVLSKDGVGVKVKGMKHYEG